GQLRIPITNRQLPIRESPICSLQSAIGELLLIMVGVVFRRRRVELPAVAIAFRDLVGRFQLFVVLIFDPQGTADVVHAVLIGRGVVAAGRFVADGVGVFPVGVDVAAGQRRAGFGVLPLGVLERGAARARRRSVPIHVQARGRPLYGLLDLAQPFALAFEAGH